MSAGVLQAVACLAVLALVGVLAWKIVHGDDSDIPGDDERG